MIDYAPAPLTVLVAEDHEDTRFMLRMLLERKGCRVVEAEDGREAVEVARREHPDLVLIDIRLPVIDGLTATRRIREAAGLQGVHIVAISGHDPARYLTAASAAGCDEYMQKPMDFARLDALVVGLALAHAGAA